MSKIFTQLGWCQYSNTDSESWEEFIDSDLQYESYLKVLTDGALLPVLT